jgi:hypothetical protein
MKLPLHDTQMRRVSRDAATGLSIYAYEGKPLPEDPDAASAERSYYLKTGTEQYLRTRVGP